MAVSSRMQAIERELPTVWMGHPTTVLASVDSTNRWMRAQWNQGTVQAGAAVWADEQTAGRGRLGREWDSPAGLNIYTSILWTPDKNRLTGIMSLVAGIALVQAVRNQMGLDARLKWPNDAVVGGRKFGGILVEAGHEPQPWAIVGLGINVNGEPNPLFSHATTLEKARGRGIDRESLWVHVMGELEKAYTDWQARGESWVQATWTACNATLGQTVRVERPGHPAWVGVAEALDTDGGLWVQGDQGRQKVISGEVSVRLADGRYAPERF
ncbi:biotin--[acetyl-CoA-carboxylase] ligase [Sulfobacillus harzensis]|uniref:biotin--[biotin carboxyl-carrier protein] ligase n=1 Tax=Sulfobacillus harzensis TaxID=2729629 RepID=A0A7Y0Q2S6_9FIRM|nr:biotin--[acetyl-CoA-carboxylase] ligase [Sulfobacillus harzensis]NMP21469.1 biotin--[acetyl-CoA-carboxylase] ligase [Sulfobacillus harzensis]